MNNISKYFDKSSRKEILVEIQKNTEYRREKEKG